MLNSIKSLYNNVSASVRVNGHCTDWFTVTCGRRQGCVLSSLSFNLYIKDLALLLESTNIGIDINGEKICLLMYADDIVILADNANNLQALLDLLHT